MHLQYRIKKIVNCIFVIIITALGFYFTKYFWGLQNISDYLLAVLVFFYLSDKLFDRLFESWRPRKDFSSVCVETVSEIMKNQIDLINTEELPQKAKKLYSLGYIAGLLSASIFGAGYRDNKFYFASLNFIYKQVFGRKEGNQYFKKAVKYIDNNNSKFKDGFEDGLNEFFKCARNEENLPLGWLKYVTS